MVKLCDDGGGDEVHLSTDFHMLAAARSELSTWTGITKLTRQEKQEKQEKKDKKDKSVLKSMALLKKRRSLRSYVVLCCARRMIYRQIFFRPFHYAPCPAC